MRFQKLKDSSRQRLNDLKPLETLKDRKLLFGYFLFVTLLMVYQHSQGWAWDFSVYSLNGQYFFHEQFYVEWKRPPLLPFILGLLQYVFSLRVSEYVFIVLNSILFLYTSFKFSEKYGFNPLYIYVLVMSPFAVFYATLEGTELLFLSFLGLMLSDIDRPRAGIWFALGFLTRYTGLVFLPIFLFQKDLKKWVYSGVLAGLVVLPWFVFNYFVLGHPFASIADSYALDVVERGLTTPFNPEDLFLITGLGIPFALLYVKEMDLNLNDFMMILTSVIIFLRQLGTKVKVRRYLYDLSLPVAFLAAKGLNLFENPERIFYLVLGLYMIGAGYLVMDNSLADPQPYQEASNQIGYCKTVSNSWPMLSYAGTPTGPLETHFKSKEKYLEQGYKIAEFKNGEYNITGNECIRKPFNSTYLERLDKVYGAKICEYVPIKTCKIESLIGKPFK